MSERYLANENFPGLTVNLLRSQGSDVLYVAETLVAASDHIVLETAVSQDRVILTFDRDFGELVFRQAERVLRARDAAAPGSPRVARVFPVSAGPVAASANVIERCFVKVRRRTRPMVCSVNVQSVGADYLFHL